MLLLKGYNPSTDSEEELLAELLRCKNDADSHEICKNSSHCSAFWIYLQQGLTPFMDKDPIKLDEFNGKFRVAAGKHRVCTALRMGIEEIDADVYQTSGLKHLISSSGEPGTFHFKHSFITGIQKLKRGDYAVLWLNFHNRKPPDGYDSVPIIINSLHNTFGEPVDIISGVSICVRVQQFLCYVVVNVQVTIAPNHANVALWLLRANSSQLRELATVGIWELETLYRKGCWRGHHINTTAVEYPGQVIPIGLSSATKP